MRFSKYAFIVAALLAMAASAHATPMDYLGNWAPTATYVQGKTIIYEGNLYFSTKNTSCPSNKNRNPLLFPYCWTKVATVGNTILNGVVNPTSPTLGTVGDFYLNTATSTLFGPKTAQGWPVTGILLIGAAGSTGAQGPAGPVGPAGADGAVGPTGPQGEPGVAGLDGAPGPAGAAGPVGPAGAPGADGAAGVAGPVGPAGPAGADGPVGPQGPAGLDGAPGIAGVDGAVGPMGPAGPAGADGAAGVDGAPGADGLDGATGPIGPQGPAGPQGVAGANGTNGAVGPAGPQGPAGATGATGATGASGTLAAPTSNIVLTPLPSPCVINSAKDSLTNCASGSGLAAMTVSGSTRYLVTTNVKYDNFGYDFAIAITPPNTCTVVLPAFYLREDNAPNAYGYQYQSVMGVYTCTNTAKTFTTQFWGYANIYAQDMAVVPLN